MLKLISEFITIVMISVIVTVCTADGLMKQYGTKIERNVEE